MATKQYSVDIASLGLPINLGKASFNAYNIDVPHHKEVSYIGTNPAVVKNSFNDHNIEIYNDTVSIEFDILNQGGRSLSSIGRSSCLISDNTLFLNNEKFQSITDSPLYGCASRGYGSDTKMFIFERSNGKVGIKKRFKYVSFDSIEELKDDEFTELRVDDKYYCSTGLKDLISYCNLSGSNKKFTELEYFNISLDYTRAIDVNFEDWQFLDLCEYIPSESLQVRTWDRLSNDILLHTRFFPIYKHFAIMMDFENGLLQVKQNDLKQIDYRLGTININSQITDNALGDLKGVYMFYATMPMCFSGENKEVINLKDIILGTNDIVKVGIDNSSFDQNIYISEPYINLYKEPKQTVEISNIDIPARFKNCFLESDYPININNTLIDGNTRYFFKNNGKNSFNISPPTKLYSMLRETEIYGNRQVVLAEPFNSDAMAMYGLFELGNDIRYSLMAISRPYGLNEDIRGSVVTGYGEGPFSYGGYGNGFTPGTGTAVNYNALSAPVDSLISMSDMAIDINPTTDGYQFILPAWTKLSTISIVDISENGATFTNWKYIDPDIIIFDPKYVIDSHSYRIIFKPIVHPIVESIDISTKVANVVIDENPLTTYNTLKKILVLSSQKINIRIGYIDDNMSINYFNHSLTVLLHITPNYLHKSITGFKTILY